MQYYDTGWIPILITFLFAGFVLLNIIRARSTAGSLFIRRIPGLNAIDEAIGRATEMGRPVLMVPGLGGLNAISIQALNIFGHVSGTAARFATPIRLCCGNAAVYTVAQEIISDVYRREGLLDRFDQDSVRFVSDRQFAFATGVSGIIHREKVAAAFLLGEFFAESLIFAETANSIGAIQVAGSTSNTQTPFFIAACDYVLIADEFYAASAYLSREPVLVGSLVGQDWVKLTLIGLTLTGTIMNSSEVAFQPQSTVTVRTQVDDPEVEGRSRGYTFTSEDQPLAEPRTKRFAGPRDRREVFSNRLFTPLKAPKPSRALEPVPEAPAEPGGVR